MSRSATKKPERIIVKIMFRKGFEVETSDFPEIEARDYKFKDGWWCITSDEGEALIAGDTVQVMTVRPL